MLKPKALTSVTANKLFVVFIIMSFQLLEMRFLSIDEYARERPT